MKNGEAVSALFREAREALGLSRQELAKRAKVPYQVVKKLEEGLWEELPESVYMRSFLERMADVLQLPPEKWKREELFRPHVDISSVVVSKADSPESKGWRLLLLFSFLGLVIAGALVWRGWNVCRQGSHVKAPVSVAKAPSPVRKAPSRVATKGKVLSTIKKGVVSSLVKEGEPDQVMAAGVELHRLEIRARELCWVWMKLDDGRIKDFILKPQEKFRVSFTDHVEMRVGNSGALTLFVDGKPLSFHGEEGQPKSLRVTPEGIEE